MILHAKCLVDGVTLFQDEVQTVMAASGYKDVQE